MSQTENEVARFFVHSLYKVLLGREPDSDGFNNWFKEISEKENFQEVYDSFLTSKEYQTGQNNLLDNSPNQFISLLTSELQDGMNIVDIGSIKLEYEPYVWHELSRYLDLKVIGFDPQLKSGITSLESLDDSTRIEFVTHGFALGDGLPQDIYINNDIATSSMYRIIQDLPFVHLNTLRNVSVQNVSTKKLDDVLTPKTIDLLKVDVQGYELKILDNARATLERVGVVLVEVEYSAIYENQPLFAEVDIFMRSHNFELVDLKNKRYPYATSTEFSGDDTLLWADAIYRNKTNRSQMLCSQALILGVLFNKWNAAEFLWQQGKQ